MATKSVKVAALRQALAAPKAAALAAPVAAPEPVAAPVAAPEPAAAPVAAPEPAAAPVAAPEPVATPEPVAAPVAAPEPAAAPVAAPEPVATPEPVAVATVFSALSDAARTVDPTAVAQLPTEAPQVFLKRLVQAVSQAADPVWEALGEPSQTWYNTAAESIECGAAIAEPAGFVANAPVAKHAAAAAKTKAPPAPKAAKPAKAPPAPKTPKAPGIVATARKLIVTHPDPLTLTKETARALMAAKAPKLVITDATLGAVISDTRATIRMAVEAGRFK